MNKLKTLGGIEQNLFKQGKACATSLHIAHSTGKQHKDVMRDIREILMGAKTAPISSYYIDARNRKKPFYILNKEQLIMLGMRYKLIDYNILKHLLDHVDGEGRRIESRDGARKEFIPLTDIIKEYTPVEELNKFTYINISNLVMLDAIGYTSTYIKRFAISQGMKEKFEVRDILTEDALKRLRIVRI